MKKTFLYIILILSSSFAFSQATMVKDIKIGGSGSSIINITSVNNKIFFRADDGIHGTEVWVSDGTNTGTNLLKDVHFGSGDSFIPSYTQGGDMINLNDTLLFSALGSSTDGVELWKSDGTDSGTVMIKDINPGFSFSSPSFMTKVNGTVFFVANTANEGIELWKTDGTTSGTVLVKDIYSGTSSSSPTNLININGLLYFSADDGINGKELWKSDGTNTGTIMVKDISPGNASTLLGNMTNLNDTLLFTANDGVQGLELWKSDGTAIGTNIVKDIYPGSQSAFNAIGLPNVYLVEVNGAIFFSAYDGTNGLELWKSNGTNSGTIMVKDIFAGNNSSWPSPLSLTNVNNVLFFAANEGINGYELWKSDGTTSGTSMVKDILTGSSPSNLQNFYNFNNTLFFSADNGVNGTELWQSNGILSGTNLLQDIFLGTNGSNAYNLCNANGVLFFSANNGTHGAELWKYDPLSTDLIDSFNNNELNIFPNPTIDKITINNAAAGSLIKIIDFSGKTVQRYVVKDSTFSCDLSTLANGIYFINVQNKDIIINKKIIVSR